jgi:predicted Zn-dependent protease
MYKDEFSFYRKSYIVEWVSGSLSINNREETIHGSRMYCNGKWFILSRHGGAGEELARYNESLVRSLCEQAINVSQQEALVEEQFVGRAEFFVSEKNHVGDLLKKTLYVASVLRDLGITGEIIFVTLDDTRRITHSLGEAEERKQNTILSIEIYQQRGTEVVKGRSQLAIPGDSGRLSEKNIDMLVEQAYRRAFWASKSVDTSTSDRGRKTVVLTPSTTSIIAKEFIKRIASIKNGNLIPGKQIVSSNLTIRDDPTAPYSPSIRVFDDECMKTRRKTLIENGALVELLGTRFNRIGLSNPGNAYGLWEPPTPLYTNLLIGKGDWSEKEIIEETKDGFLIDGASSYMIRRDVVTIYPESAWRIKRGELVEPIAIKEIKLPLMEALSNIDAIGRNHEKRCSWEKHWLICEESLMLRTLGYIL